MGQTPAGTSAGAVLVVVAPAVVVVVAGGVPSMKVNVRSASGTMADQSSRSPSSGALMVIVPSAAPPCWSARP